MNFPLWDLGICMFSRSHSRSGREEMFDSAIVYLQYFISYRWLFKLCLLKTHFITNSVVLWR